MSGTHAGSVASPFRQPKAVFAVAFACVVSFMGIGLVDPILPAAAIAGGIVILSTAHQRLAAAQRVQAEQAAHHVPAEGQILLHAADHGAAGRMVAEYADAIGASTIVVGAPTHGGLPALMDASASRELWRHAHSNILVVNPDAPGTWGERPADAELLRWP